MIHAYKILARKPDGRDHMEGLGVRRRIILERILENWTGRCVLKLSGSG